jgi:cytochrome P450
MPPNMPHVPALLPSPYLLHRDPDHWKEPLRFNPDRWLDLLQPGAAAATNGNGTTTSGSSSTGGDNGSGGSSGGGYPFAAALREMGPNGAYVPFGGGPRNCIGAGFAMMEAVLVLAALLQRYELAPAPGRRFPRPKALLTLRPEGAPLRVVSRRTGA